MITVFPATLPRDANRIRGANRIYVAPWAAAGADPAAADIVYLGQVSKGGANVNIGREYVELEGEESYSPDGDVLVKETCLIKATLEEAPIDVIAALRGAPMTFQGSGANTWQSSDIKGSTSGANTILQWGYGGLQTRPGQAPVRYYQLLVESPNEDPTAVVPTQWTEPSKRGYWQIFMCRLDLAGDLTFTKENIVKLSFEAHARWDWTITPAATTLPSVNSIGHLFRRVNIYST